MSTVANKILRFESVPKGLCAVDASVEAAHEARHGNVKDFADAQERRNGDWTPGLNLLPMSRRETERDHILLGIAVLSPQTAHSLAQRTKELLLIRHMLGCRLTRAKTPRAD